MIFAGKKVLVFGTGKSGIAAEELLHKKGASVVLYDGNDKLEKEEILKKLESRDSVEVVLGELPEEMLDSLDLVVLSPGVPTDLPVVLKMKEKEIPVIGEVELAYQVSRGKVLAITGTNGKTTTTSLLGEIMKAYQPEVKVVGNIGTPYTSAALDTTDDTVTVAEISSFQLETIKEFHPAASAITNITEDHLNRHHTMEEYIRVKECITENQTMDDLCVLNYEDEILRPFGEKLMAEKKVQVMYFSSLRALKDGIYYQDGEIRIAKNGETELLTRTDDLKLLGLHNFENVMVASAMALHAGVPMETVRKVIQEFAGVEHRIEYVCEKDGVAYYNDSKGTNPDAAIKGIQAMNRPTLLIGGGYDKTFPVLAVVDPELMATVPPRLTAYQGFDALFHSTEGYLNNTAYVMSDLYALEAIRLIGKSLETAVKDGSNLDARADVALANTLAGMVESTSGCTSEHSFAHALSAFHPQFEHGAALISVSCAYYSHWAKSGCCDERLVRMARALGKTDASKPSDFVDALAALQKACGVDDIRMSAYGVQREHLEQYVQNARATMGGLYAVDPAPLSDDDVRAIFEASYR